MVVTMQKAADSVVAYLSQEAMKIPSMKDKFLMFAALGAAKANTCSLIAPYKDTLSMLEILNTDGMVDTDTLRKSTDMAFANVPTFSALGFTFSADDASRIISLMEA